MVKYKMFLRNLRAKCGRERIVLYMDNLLIHKYNSTLRVYDELNIIPVFAPISSPELNPIEFLFSKLKALTRKARLKDLVSNRRRTYNEIVPEIVRKVTKEDVNNLFIMFIKLILVGEIKILKT